MIDSDLDSCISVHGSKSNMQDAGRSCLCESAYNCSLDCVCACACMCVFVCVGWVGVLWVCLWCVCVCCVCVLVCVGVGVLWVCVSVCGVCVCMHACVWGVGGCCGDGCVCVHVCFRTSTVLYIRNYVSYTSWKRFVCIAKLLIIMINWTCSCCALLVLYDLNITKTKSSAHFYVTGK